MQIKINMFEDDLDIDFDEVLSYSQSNSLNLKRQNAEQFIQEPNKKLKMSPFIDSDKNPSSDLSYDLSSTDTSLSPGFTKASNELKKKFHFKKVTKTPPVELNIQNQMKSPQLNTNSDSISGLKNPEVNRTNSEISRIIEVQNHNFVTTSSDKIYLEKNRSSKVNITKRRFPGPAGLLPERCFENFNLEEDKSSSKVEEEICSQSTCLVLNEGPWQKMRIEFLPKSPEEIYLPDKYNIQWIKSRATMRKLINQKAPFLAAFVHSINSHSIQNPIVNLILKDKTGTIQGTILHNLYEEYSNELVVGSVIVLKELGVLNTGSRSEPYLTITSNNLISIYTTAHKFRTTEDISHTEQSKIIVQNISASVICSNINESKRLHQVEVENIKNTQRIPSLNNDALKPLNICDNFKKAISNLNSKQPTGQLQPNLNNLRTNFSMKNESTMDHKTIKTNFIEQDKLKFIHKNSAIKPSEVSDNTENINEIMDLFNTQEGLDEFFNEEPNFCSTQITCIDADEKNFTENRDMSTKIDSKRTDFNGSLLKDTEKENRFVIEDMLEGLDTDALFNDF